jgi:hypothetical protein
LVGAAARPDFLVGVAILSRAGLAVRLAVKKPANAKTRENAGA